MVDKGVLKGFMRNGSENQ